MNADGDAAVQVIGTELLSSDWHPLRKTTFRHRHSDGSWITKTRESYHPGDGAAVLPCDAARRTVLLSRQFRWPVHVADAGDAQLIEVAAGMTDGLEPLPAVKREAMEEMGVLLHGAELVTSSWMSPGSVVQRIHLFIASYTPADRVGVGGGIREEGEDIAVVEISIDEALRDVRTGTITDAKTIILLQWAALGGPFTESNSIAPS